MIYSYTITTPANTTAAAPLITSMKLTRGIIHKFQLIVPPGPQGLLHVIVRNAIHQVFPSNTESNFSIDNANLEYRVHESVDDGPLQLQAHTWNLDDTHAHTCTLLVGLLPKSILTPWLMSWRERFAGAPAP
jgi:hypothetical protein